MSTTRDLSPDRPAGLRERAVAIAEDLHWLHSTLGLVGNVCFFAGSVMFLWESTKLAAIWLFIVGSLGMLLGSVGDKVTQLEHDDDG